DALGRLLDLREGVRTLSLAGVLDRRGDLTAVPDLLVGVLRRGSLVGVSPRVGGAVHEPVHPVPQRMQTARQTVRRATLVFGHLLAKQDHLEADARDHLLL